ncbi:MAG: AAA family ATPase [Methanosarcina sp.]
MKFINKINITNYKAIQEMTFSCNSINILVGPNNTGKSSILESIGIGVSSLNDFKDIFGKGALEISPNGNIKYIINSNQQGNLRSEIQMELSNSKDFIDVTLKYYPEGLPEKEEEKNLFFEYISSLKYSDLNELRFRSRYHYNNEKIMRLLSAADALENNIQSEKIMDYLYNISQEFENELQNFKNDLITSEKLVISSRRNNKLNNLKMVKGRIFNIYSEKISDSLSIPLLINKYDNGNMMLYNKLFEAKKLSSVIAYLKEKIPYFEEIREKDDILYVFLKDVSEPLPLSFMGEGFKSLLKHSFMAALIKNGIIIFEEPEITMHPGYLGVFADEIMNNSDNYQTFISTHSLELLKYILNAAKKSEKLGEINIIRLSRYNTGYIEREIISGKDAKEEIEEINTDLRGF